MIRLGNFNVVLDSCVLYDSLLRDLLLKIAEKELYQPIWSDEIFDEVKRNLIVRPNVTEEKVDRLLSVMKSAFPEAMCTSNSKSIELQNTNIDNKDKHVVSTAICSNAQVIITNNLKHFPADDLNSFTVEAQTPDQFLTNIWYLSYRLVIDVYKDLEASYKNPPYPREQLLSMLEKRVPNFVNLLKPHLEENIIYIH